MTGTATVVSANLSFVQGPFDISLMEYGGSAVAHLTMSDGSTEHFGWYHDEISYSPEDFADKTMAQIREMHFQRDLAYLRS